MAPSSSSSLFLSILSRENAISMLLSSPLLISVWSCRAVFADLEEQALLEEKDRIFLEERNFSIYYSTFETVFGIDFRNMNIVIDISL